jgi:hypothetical protein
LSLRIALPLIAASIITLAIVFLLFEQMLCHSAAMKTHTLPAPARQIAQASELIAAGRVIASHHCMLSRNRQPLTSAVTDRIWFGPQMCWFKLPVDKIDCGRPVPVPGPHRPHHWHHCTPA